MSGADHADPLDHERVRRTLAFYCHLCDDGRFEEWAELFTDDATFRVLGQTHQGRDAIRGFIEAALPPERRGKHLISLPVIDIDGDEARAHTDYSFVAKQGDGHAVTSVGRYIDRLERYGAKWRFTSREIVFLGDQPQEA